MKTVFGILVIWVSLAFCATPLRADNSPSPFEFVVVDKGHHAELPDSLQSAYPESRTNVLFSLEDISEYKKSTHTIVLTTEAIDRLHNLFWWNWMGRKAGTHYFHIVVNGEYIYTGKLFSMFNSSMASPGAVVTIPFFVLEKDRFSINLVEPKIDHRNDARIMKVLAEAGVLSE